MKRTKYFAIRFPNQEIIASEYYLEDEKQFLSLSNLPDEESWIICPFKITKNAPVLVIPKSKTRQFNPIPKQENDLKLPDFQHINHTFDIQSCIEKIKQGQIQKIVFSAMFTTENSKISIWDIFSSLCSALPETCTFLFETNENEYWIGASPELLLAQNKLQIESYSIAGTLHEENSQWSDKEKDEQEIVTKYILDTINPFVNNFTTEKNNSIKNFGKITHLATQIKSELLPNVSITNLIEKLYPTPALNGFPKKESMDFLAKIEKHDREYYGGFIGLWNPKEQETTLYVILRCMKVLNNNLHFYAGCGITKNSVATDEWNEIIAKVSNLVNAVNKQQ